VLQHEEVFRRAYAAYRNEPADFADYLILGESEAAGHALVTFDRRLQRTAGVTRG
jgi:predicted nucleic-acid-binding protein